MSLAIARSKPYRPVPYAPWLAVVATLLALAAAAPAVRHAFALGELYIYKVWLGAAVGGASVAWLAATHLGTRRFGAANHVTLARAAVVVLLAGLLGEAPAPELGWLAAGATLVVLVLDGVDGRLARSRGTASRFGARFDMETDALLALALALLVVHFDKAGAFVLVAGLMRYAFAAAGAVRPKLKRPLPPSRRRQTVCVAQIATLGLCLVPWLGRPVSDALAACVVAAVGVSFAIDLRRLSRADDRTA